MQGRVDLLQVINQNGFLDTLSILDSIPVSELVKLKIQVKEVYKYLNITNRKKFKQIVGLLDRSYQDIKKVRYIDGLIFKEILRDHINKLDKKTIHAVCKEVGLCASMITYYIKEGIFEPSYVDLFGKVYLDKDDVDFLLTNKEMCKTLYSVSDVSQLTGITTGQIKNLYDEKKIESVWLGLNGTLYFDKRVVDILNNDKKRTQELNGVTAVRGKLGISHRKFQRLLDLGEVAPDYVSMTGALYFDDSSIELFKKINQEVG